MADGEAQQAADGIVRILVATDIHLGFMERDPLRGSDSFEAFEEVLQHARSRGADMVLLGGDLFHENTPSRSCLHRCASLLREYCLGPRPVPLQLLSDAGAALSSAQPSKSARARANYEDENVNVELPVFAVHGNHDDPSGVGNLAALDVLAACNLVNYFGKAPDVEDIQVTPLLFDKNGTKFALYGLGNVRDERLCRTFEQRRVKLLRPAESNDEWFNILVLHQNRSPHAPKGFVHEGMIDPLIDFVIWGHEHECLIRPQESAGGSLYVSQPGSTVVVSLTEGEAKQKCCGMLEISRDGAHRMKPIPLQTARPFKFESLVLSEQVPAIDPTDDRAVLDLLRARVDALVKQAADEAPQAAGAAPQKLPLVRIRVDLTGGYSPINPIKFGQDLVGVVANPAEVIAVTRKKTPAGRTSVGSRASRGGAADDEDLVDNADLLIDVGSGSAGVEKILDGIVDGQAGAFTLCPVPEFKLALQQHVDKDNKLAISDLVKRCYERARAFLSEDRELTDRNAIREKRELQAHQAQQQAAMEDPEEVLKQLEQQSKSAPSPPPAKMARGRKKQSSPTDDAPAIAFSDEEEESRPAARKKRAAADEGEKQTTKRSRKAAVPRMKQEPNSDDEESPLSGAPLRSGKQLGGESVPLKMSQRSQRSQRSTRGRSKAIVPLDVSQSHGTQDEVAHGAAKPSSRQTVLDSAFGKWLKR
eukprot:m51a1_g3476 putative double-strand break repair protein MRE11 (703) ;mRNA; r:760975-763659